MGGTNDGDVVSKLVHGESLLDGYRTFSGQWFSYIFLFGLDKNMFDVQVLDNRLSM